ncbi:MAG: hypothetical protein F2773_08020 [Actinobacteria bacterium]|nr:hypothetical protein [Actinomycetota bacterium]
MIPQKELYVMAMLAFGSPLERRGLVAVMRMVATAVGTRPFDGDRADLVRMFAGLESCSGCHGFPESLDFSDLTGDIEPWADGADGIAEIMKCLPGDKQRLEAVHAGLLVALYSIEQDPVGLSAARWISKELGASDSMVRTATLTAGVHSHAAQADLFRRFMSERIGVPVDEVRKFASRKDLGAITAPALNDRYHRLLEQAPDGSLGGEMRRFYSDAPFAVPGTPGVPLPVEFLGSHDVHHVLAGYDTMAHGEVYTAVFNAGNAAAGIGWLSVVLLQWHQGIKIGVFNPAHAHLDPAIVADAAQRGAATHVDVYSYEWDWMSLLERPLDEVRGSLGIPPGGTVLAGATWNPKSE